MGVTNEKSKPKDGKQEDKQDGKPAGDKTVKKSEEKERTATDSFKKFWQDPWHYLMRFGILLPHLLPSANLDTYLRYVCVIICSFTKRGLNLLIPLELGRIVNLLESSRSTSEVLKNVSIFIFLKFLNSGSGISSLESRLWRPIESEAATRLNVASYRHVMSLSSDYHDNKKSAAVWEGVRSGRSVIYLINTFSFDLAPKLLDFVLSLGILWTRYDVYTASVAGVTMVAHNLITVRNQNRRRQRIRANVNSRSTEANVLMETSTNWQTVAYFNRFEYEFKRYEDAVHTTQQSSQDDRSTYMFWNSVQQAVLLLGLWSACVAVASQVQNGLKTPSDFVVFTTYWNQLIGPLTSFIGIFMYVGRTLVETEKLVEIFETQPSVKESKDAKEIEIGAGKIEFRNVGFGYKAEREILRDVSFQCIPGSTTAIVGETGGGKSTILKLMARMYDTTTGSVIIDQQDVKDVTLNSLRELFGHVPQNVGVFNTTILENLKYAKLDATESECHEACKAAALHDRILAFPEGYETVVGEKGVKLSGGELQRLAIARVVLKNPKILLLDEATSSVDTVTEATIQESLQAVSKGRTTIVVAHRLSTVARADLILVVKEGQIVEKGTHDILLAMKGTYYELWTKQQVKKSGNVKVLHRAKSCPSLGKGMAVN